MADMYDGFEDGDVAEWVFTGAGSNKITATTAQAASGTHSGLQTDGISTRDLPDAFSGTVTLTVEWRVDQTTAAMWLHYSGSQDAISIGIENGAWFYYSGGKQSVGGSPSANTWMTVELVADVGTDTFDFIVDGTTLGTGLPFRNAVNAIDSVRVEELNANNFWVDDLQTDGPAAPSGLSITGTTDTSADLSWTDNATSESGFYVYRATASGELKSDYTQIADITTADTTTYTDTGLLNGERYYYRVTAYNADGESSVSNEDSGITDLPAPTNLSVDAVNGDQFDLSFTDNSDNEDGFRVYRKPDGYLSFDEAASEYVDIGDPGAQAVTEGTDWTVSLVLNAETRGGTRIAYSEGNPVDWSSNLFIVYFPDAGDDAKVWYRDGGGTGGGTKMGTGYITLGEDYVVTVRKQGTTIDVRIDGVNAASNTTTGLNPLTVSSASFGAGDNAGTWDQFATGDVKRCLKWTRALSDSEVATVEAGNTVSDGQVGYYDFSSGSGTTLVDSSPNNNDGTLVNSPTWHGGGTWTQDGTDIAAVTTAEPNTVTHTTANLLDGEKYAIKSSVFTEHTETEDI